MLHSMDQPTFHTVKYTVCHNEPRLVGEVRNGDVAGNRSSTASVHKLQPLTIRLGITRSVLKLHSSTCRIGGRKRGVLNPIRVVRKPRVRLVGHPQGERTRKGARGENRKVEPIGRLTRPRVGIRRHNARERSSDKGRGVRVRAAASVKNAVWN